MEELLRLREITRTLREPGGCDWDRAQDWQSMRPHLVEEAYEVVEAVNTGRPARIKDELGDVLFLVHFFARLAEEEGSFTIEDVARSVNEKLVRRHPHVFAGASVNGVEDILRNWEEIKRNEVSDDGPARSERGAPIEGSILKKGEESLPALFRAAKIQEKVARVGFDWPDTTGVLEKIVEESRELAAEVEAVAEDQTRHVERSRRVEEELGDLLFSVVNLARHLGANPELALQGAVDRFVRRFREVERLAAARGTTVADSTMGELDALWEEVKRA